MPEYVVTLIRCGQCGRDGTLTLQGDRFWCSWCGDWTNVETREVADARVVEEGGVSRLVSGPPQAPALQPLRVPAGWLVEYHALSELDPADEQRVPEADRRLLFRQDLLQMGHGRRERVLDVGWYPEGDLEGGQYVLVLYDGDFRGRLAHEFSTRDRLALVAEIERLLQAVADGNL